MIHHLTADFPNYSSTFILSISSLIPNSCLSTCLQISKSITSPTTKSIKLIYKFCSFTLNSKKNSKSPTYDFFSPN